MVPLQDVKKILVIKLRAIGDVLLSTIVLKNLWYHFPDAQLDFLTEPPSREILEGNSFIDNIVIFDRKQSETSSFLRQLRRSHYDLVIDLFGNPRTAFMTYVTRAKSRVGFDFRGRRYAYNFLVPSRGAEVHNTEFNLDALRALGIGTLHRDITFDIPSSAEEYVSDFIRVNRLEAETLIALNPSGTWYTKRWGFQKFAKLGDMLALTFKAKIVLLWGPGEIQDAQQIRSLMRQPSIIPPPTTLKQLGALLKRCALVVSNDAGPMHIAAVLGVPTLGVYGPTNPLNQGPLGEKSSWVRLEGLECLGCNLTACPIGHLCMERLSVDVIMRGVEKLVEENQIIVAA